MIVGEAIARLAIITKAEIIYDGVSHASVWPIYWSFVVQAFVLVKDTPVCGTDSNVAQINKLVVVEWWELSRKISIIFLPAF